jgi:hypothetical protein
VEFAYAANTSYGITTTLTHAEAPVTLPAGVEGDVAGAAQVTATLSVSGQPNDTVTAEGVVVGKVTVKIS